MNKYQESLQIIQDNITPRTLGILTVEFNIVEKALDRLGALEKENKKLNFENQALRNGIDLDLNAKLLSENEKIKKENKKWREIVGCDLCEALGREILLEENEKFKKIIDDLKLENSNLKHSIDEKNEIIGDLEEEVKDTASFYMSKCEKFKKVIDILKDRFVIKLYIDSFKRPRIDIDCITAILNQEQYDLLKEVFENENNFN